jgi:hypothetical protein
MTALLSGLRNENISIVICMLVHLMIPSWSFNLGTTTAMLCHVMRTVSDFPLAKILSRTFYLVSLLSIDPNNSSLFLYYRSN